MNLTGKTVVITGAAGFIGSNLALYCLKQKARVIGIDNLSTGRIQNVTPLAEQFPDRFEFIREDIRNAEAIKAIFETARPFITLHLAALASVQLSMTQPLLANDINVTGFINILQASQAIQTPYFFYASSSAVYGEQATHPIAESASTNPLSVYGLTKLVNEQYAKLLNHPPTKTIGMRLFNVFGPNQLAQSDYAAVIPKWVALLKAGEAITIFGDGEATRDFCHVDNIGTFMSAVVNNPSLADTSIFNVGSGTATTLNQLIAAISEALGKTSSEGQLQYAPWRTSDIVHSTADLCYAEEILGFKANIDLKTGLKKLLVP